MTVTLWPHQARTISELTALLDGPPDSICVTAPTGAGKTRCMVEIIKWATDRAWRVALYTNRRLLTEQISSVLDDHGVNHGIRASEWQAILMRDVQVSSIQTEEARVYRSQKWSLHAAQLVLVDEAHSQKSKVACKIISEHCERGARVVGWTATPLGLGHLYNRLLISATNSECRECGALLPCYTYGPDEPDMRHIKKQKTGEYAYQDVTRAIMTQTIFARVIEWYRQLNPDQRPTILFAPGVPESRWFVDQFAAEGIRAAHIDGEDVYCDGVASESTRLARDQILDQVRSGDIKIVCNRFVLREGLDIPELYMCILATVFGSVGSYLQSGGRLLRNHHSLPGHVVLLDHGGSWHRHGSLNADRQWDLEQDAREVSALRDEFMRSGKDREPIVCPQCKLIRSAGRQCPQCGYEHPVKKRLVVQHDGSLKEMRGDIYRDRRRERRGDTVETWRRMFYRARKSGMTFRQAEGLFWVENKYWPPRDLELMPGSEVDWIRKVQDVPMERLSRAKQRHRDIAG